VYGLFDPTNGQLRYIGKTCDLVKTKSRHSRDGSHTHKAFWIRKLKANGWKPEIFVMDTFQSESQAFEGEIQAISYYRAIGCNLTNATLGGDGATGFRHSEATKSEVSKRSKGNTWGRLGKGTRRSEETKLRMSSAQLGHPVSDETRLKMSRAARNRQRTDAEKQQLVNAATEWRKSNPARIIKDETRRKMSIAAKNKSVSDVTRKKLSEAAKRQWQLKRGAA
jgi:hypothetical protein